MALLRRIFQNVDNAGVVPYLTARPLVLVLSEDPFLPVFSVAFALCFYGILWPLYMVIRCMSTVFRVDVGLDAFLSWLKCPMGVKTNVVLHVGPIALCTLIHRALSLRQPTDVISVACEMVVSHANLRLVVGVLRLDGCEGFGNYKGHSSITSLVVTLLGCAALELGTLHSLAVYLGHFDELAEDTAVFDWSYWLGLFCAYVGCWMVFRSSSPANTEKCQLSTMILKGAGGLEEDFNRWKARLAIAERELRSTNSNIVTTLLGLFGWNSVESQNLLNEISALKTDIAKFQASAT
jgi:hypothetical protein